MQAKKSLGQNFLTSKQALRDIMSSSRLVSEDTVLEVGPGKGVLTEAILETGATVLAVEKDDELIGFLKEKFSHYISNGKLTIIHDDILSFNPSSYNLQPTNYKLIGNIPYYITGALIRRFLSETTQPSLMTLMLQKEVAKRIVARDKKESLLSISVKAYGTPHYVDTVEAKYFRPKPKVDSAIITIENISKDFFGDILEEHFFHILKLGFEHKRKMLAGNLAKEFEKENIVSAMAKAGLEEKTRAENVSLEQWKILAKHLNREKESTLQLQ